MCGIAGVSRFTPVTRRLLPILLYDIENRGTDSFGATDGVEIYKDVGTISSGYEIIDLVIANWQRGIFHTRAASVGAATVENAHPFAVTANGELLNPSPEGYLDLSSAVVGIHNGHLANYTELNTLHNRSYAVDSPHIFAHLAAGLPMNNINGWGAVAWFNNIDLRENEPPGHIHLCRFNMTDLYVAKLTTGEVVFCSTRTPIARGALLAGSSVKTFYTIDPETIYKIKPARDEEGDGVFVGGKLPFGYRYAATAARTHTAGGHRGSGVYYPSAHSRSPWGMDGTDDTDSDDESLAVWTREARSRAGTSDNSSTITLSSTHCAMCGKEKVDRSQSLVCPACLERITKRFSLDVEIDDIKIFTINC